MPDPAGTFNDGGIRLIEQTISLKDSTGSPVDYILKKCSLKGGSSRLVSQNKNGVETHVGTPYQADSNQMAMYVIWANDPIKDLLVLLRTRSRRSSTLAWMPTRVIRNT